MWRVSDKFPLDSKVREGTQTGRPKAVLKHVLNRYKELPATVSTGAPVVERMSGIKIEKMDSPIDALRRILAACWSQEDLVFMWPGLRHVLASKKKSVRRIIGNEEELLEFFFSERWTPGDLYQ